MKWSSWLLIAIGGMGTAGLMAMPSGLQGEDKKEDGQGVVVEIDGLKSRAPSAWKKDEPTIRLRVYQFKLARAGADKQDAEVVVFFFGTGSGGSAQDNIKRWKGMFLPPQGKKIEDVTRVEEMKVGDVEATYVDIQGTYRFKARPADPNAKEELRPDYRMIGVIFASKNGPYFMRLLGPTKTVEHHKKEFDAWLKGFGK